MVEGMTVVIKPMTNKGNKILNASIKIKIMVYLHLIYLFIFYVIYMWVYGFFCTNTKPYICIYFISL